MDVDGPCAFPQPIPTRQSVADPLATLGFMLISFSFILALIFFVTEDEDSKRIVASVATILCIRKGGPQRILSYDTFLSILVAEILKKMALAQQMLNFGLNI